MKFPADFEHSVSKQILTIWSLVLFSIPYFSPVDQFGKLITLMSFFSKTVRIIISKFNVDMLCNMIRNN